MAEFFTSPSTALGNYNATPPTLSDGQAGALQVDAQGRLLVSSAGGSGAAIGTTADPAVTDGADNSSAATLVALTKGYLIDLGQKADAAWTSGSGSVIALLKAIAGAAVSTTPVRVHSTYPAVNVTTKTTTVVVNGAGQSPGFFINAVGTTDTLTFYDSLTASGTVLATITVAAGNLGWNAFPVKVTTGLTVVTGGGTAGNYTFFGEAG